VIFRALAPAARQPGSQRRRSFVVSSSLHDQYQFYVFANTTAYLYEQFEDAWTLLPSPGLAGTFGAGP
jgi:hypothetical protein